MPIWPLHVYSLFLVFSAFFSFRCTALFNVDHYFDVARLFRFLFCWSWIKREKNFLSTKQKKWINVNWEIEWMFLAKVQRWTEYKITLMMSAVNRIKCISSHVCAKNHTFMSTNDWVVIRMKQTNELFPKKRELNKFAMLWVGRSFQNERNANIWLFLLSPIIAHSLQIAVEPFGSFSVSLLNTFGLLFSSRITYSLFCVPYNSLSHEFVGVLYKWVSFIFLILEWWSALLSSCIHSSLVWCANQQKKFIDAGNLLPYTNED